MKLASTPTSITRSSPLARFQELFMAGSRHGYWLGAIIESRAFVPISPARFGRGDPWLGAAIVTRARSSSPLRSRGVRPRHARVRLRRHVESRRGGDRRADDPGDHSEQLRVLWELDAAEQDARLCALHACARCAELPRPRQPGNFPPLTQQALGVSKQTSLPAQQACKHLLERRQRDSQQRQQKIAFGVKVAQCLRAHGYPNFPDPTGLGSRASSRDRHELTAVPDSETACEKQAQKALGVP